MPYNFCSNCGSAACDRKRSSGATRRVYDSCMGRGHPGKKRFWGLFSDEAKHGLWPLRSGPTDEERHAQECREEQERLRREQARVAEEQERLRRYQQVQVREDQERQRQERLLAAAEHKRKCREEQERLRREQARVAEEQERPGRYQVQVREDQERQRQERLLAAAEQQRSRLAVIAAIEIRGLTSAMTSSANVNSTNGFFDPTSEVINGMAAYKKRGDDDVWLCYTTDNLWTVQSTAFKGTNRGWAFINCTSILAPDLTPSSSQWMISDNSNTWQSQPVMVGKPIIISGAQSAMASDANVCNINGIFDPAPEVVNGATAYKKRSDDDIWLCYTTDESWMVQPMACKGTNRGWAFVACASLVPPDQVASSSPWMVLENNNIWQPQPAVKVTTAPRTVLISGATSAECDAGSLNGLFDPTSEVINGATAYKKRDDDDVWLRYTSNKSWMLQSKADKGKNTGWAYVNCSSPVSPDQVPSSSKWMICNKHKLWQAQPAVKAVSVAHAALITFAAGKAAAEKIAKEKAERERLVTERLRIAVAAKAAAEQVAQEKDERELLEAARIRIAAAAKAAVEQAEKEKVEFQRREFEKLPVVVERTPKDRADRDRLEAERLRIGAAANAAAENTAKETAERERKEKEISEATAAAKEYSIEAAAAAMSCGDLSQAQIHIDKAFSLGVDRAEPRIKAVSIWLLKKPFIELSSAEVATLVERNEALRSHSSILRAAGVNGSLLNFVRSADDIAACCAFPPVQARMLFSMLPAWKADGVDRNLIIPLFRNAVSSPLLPAPPRSVGARSALEGGGICAFSSASGSVTSPAFACGTEKFKDERREAAIQKAKRICNSDIAAYGAAWEDLLTAEGPAVQQLGQTIDKLIRRMPACKTLQPRGLGGFPSNSPEYLALLKSLHDVIGNEAIFAKAKALAAKLNLTFKEGPDKKNDRIYEKAYLCYDGDFSQLTDLRRCSIVCPSIMKMNEVFSQLSVTPGLDVVRIKDRLRVSYDAKEESAGYRDVQLNIRASGATPVIWELQLHIKAMEDVKTGQEGVVDEHGRSGHARYRERRDIIERLLKK